MGSQLVWDLKYRDAFIFIGEMGKKECFEK